MSTQTRFHFGWVPDIPDFRDYNTDSTTIRPLLRTLGAGASSNPTLPSTTDLRQWCPPVEDQESLGSCTANAGVGLLEYFEIRAFGRHIDASRLFLYKVTRKLMGMTGDTGAYLRDTMKAMALFGVPPEDSWPYVIADFENEPTAYCYAFAQNYQALQYYRLDPPGVARPALLERIKNNLAHGLPSMFGFTVYNSINNPQRPGEIPFPSRRERWTGGHAVVTVGYDDDREITNPYDGSKTTGALLIRNSWGTDWGDKGYGWLPYEYVSQSLAVDWWSLLKSEWVDTGAFD